MIKTNKFLTLILLFSLAGCGMNSNNSNSNDLSSSISDIESNISTSSLLESNSESSSVEEFNIQTLNDEVFRLSSIHDFSNSTKGTTYKVFAPHDDNYILTCDYTEKIEVLDLNGTVLAEGKKSTEVNLKKNQHIYVKLTIPSNKLFTLKVSSEANEALMPYDINSNVDISSFSTTGDNNVNPLKPAEVKYTKRDDGKGLYVNCNNPELLTLAEMNKVLTRQEVTNKDVFFTFEHNNGWSGFYYGYRVTNTGSDDIFVTIRNLGFHANGAGSWLGEDEWIKFYNTKFISDIDDLTASQKANYNAMVGFTNQYESENRQPITYRIPSGKYIYVMGGTTKDAYRNINVFDSANVSIKRGCSNGAVLFSVSGGQAEGAFMAYTDNDANEINNSEYVKGNKENGYVVTRNGDDVGSQYVGYDNCHGVVDADLTWTFNDLTPSGVLPVSYVNEKYTNYKSGEPYAKIPSFSKQTYTAVDKWITHLNPNHTRNAIGTDMTKYITTDNATGKAISIDTEHYDGKGNTANIGNWMIDYIDTFTLINQGDQTRTFTYNLYHAGVILAFVRDENGFIDKTFKPKYWTKIGASDYGEAIDDQFEYSIEVKPHSIVRFSVDYNLLANSYGCIRHEAKLK